MSRYSPILQKYLACAKKNAKYTSKTIPHSIIRIYADKVREKITENARAQNQPFTIIYDECTDPHRNQSILSVFIRFVDLRNPTGPQIVERLQIFVQIKSANAETVTATISIQC
jgi:hypothetical protein